MSGGGKYHAQPTERDGIRFASKREAARYDELRLLERAGEIRDLRLQVRYRCEVNGVHVCDYLSDFTFYERAEDGVTWRLVVEDVKSEATRRIPVYRLKKKLVFALYGVDIRET